MSLDKVIKSRKSVRKFSEKKPDWRDIIEAIDSMRYSPKAGNIFSLNVILVSKKEKIKKIAEAAQQDFISNAKYVVIVYSNSETLENAYGEKGKLYSKQQAGAAIENFILSLEEKGLSTCWVGYLVEETIKKEFKIEGDVEAVFPIGYEDKTIYSKTKKKPRIELDNFLYFEKHGNKQMKEIKSQT